MLAPIIELANSPYKVTWDSIRDLRVIGLKDRATELISVNPKTGAVNATKLYKYLTDKIHQHKPRLVIIDALYDVYAANINDSVQVRKFMRMIRKLCSVAPPCSVIVLGHPSMSGMASGTGTAGAMAWRNAARGFPLHNPHRIEGRGRPRHSQGRGQKTELRQTRCCDRILLGRIVFTRARR